MTENKISVVRRERRLNEIDVTRIVLKIYFSKFYHVLINLNYFCRIFKFTYLEIIFLSRVFMFHTILKFNI